MLRVHGCLFLAALGVAGCGEDTVVYQRPDATPWGEARCSRVEVPPRGLGFVSNSLMNSVATLDLGAAVVRDTFPVGVTPLAENGPHHLVFDPVRQVIFTPLSFPAPAISPGPHSEHGSASVPGVLVKRSACDMQLLGRVDVDPNPGDLVMSPDRRRIYVSHYDLRRALENANDPPRQRSNLVVVDAETMARVQSIPTCVAAHGMVIAPDGNTLYMACYGDDAVGVVDLRAATPTVRLAYITGSPPARVTSPVHGPYSLGLSPDGNTLWVGCTVSGALVAYDVTTGQVDANRITRRLAGKPFFPEVSRDGATMLVPTQSRDELVRLRTNTLEFVQRMTFNREDCIQPHQVSRGPDGLEYLVCEGAYSGQNPQHGTILALDPDSLAIRHRYTVGYYPDAIVFAAGTATDGGVR